MTDRSKWWALAGVLLVALVLDLAAARPAAAQAEREICGLIKTYCKKVDGVRVNELLCRSARTQKQNNGYKCGKGRRQQTGAGGLKVCRGKVQAGRGPVVSYSYDTKNPSIFAYCVKGSGPEARECAYRACIEKGGSYCQPPCNPNTGEETRACHAEVVTLIRSRDYFRLGCGARHVGPGKMTFDSYVKRELSRCLEKSKSPGSCRLEAAWQ